MNTEFNKIIVLVKICNQYSYYRSARDIWVLDTNKWRNEFLEYGYNIPEFNSAFRFGFKVVSEHNVSAFLQAINKDLIDKESLSYELAQRFQTANSFWDVSDLFPIMFVDFDSRYISAFYYEGVAMERYIPDGWVGEFVDFCTEYSEEKYPSNEKYWIKGDFDLLKLLIDRGNHLEV